MEAGPPSCSCGSPSSRATSAKPRSMPWTSRLTSCRPPSPEQASVGGEAYNDSRPSISLAEGIGVLVALVVLLLTLGSLRAAGMPLLTALLGVGITMSLIIGATAFAVISSTTPLLALMLGLAVGIDYALFITSRHRDQLRGGMALEESVARAVATAGSAVVFAGSDGDHRAVRARRGPDPVPDHHGRGRGDRSGYCGADRADPAAGAARLRRRTAPAAEHVVRGAGTRRSAQARTGRIPRALGPAGDQDSGADCRARGRRAGRHGLSGEGSADRPAQQRGRRPGHPGAGHLRPDQRALRRGLQRAVDRLGDHRQHRRPARL